MLAISKKRTTLVTMVCHKVCHDNHTAPMHFFNQIKQVGFSSKMCVNLFKVGDMIAVICRRLVEWGQHDARHAKALDVINMMDDIP